MKLYVGNLHCNISEEMLKGIFEPFGRIQSIQLMKDQETDRSKGYGFITYMEAEDAKKAMEHLNGFELAGKDMKVKLLIKFVLYFILQIGPQFNTLMNKNNSFN